MQISTRRKQVQQVQCSAKTVAAVAVLLYLNFQGAVLSMGASRSTPAHYHSGGLSVFPWSVYSMPYSEIFATSVQMPYKHPIKSKAAPRLYINRYKFPIDGHRITPNNRRCDSPKTSMNPGLFWPYPGGWLKIPKRGQFASCVPVIPSPHPI